MNLRRQYWPVVAALGAMLCLYVVQLQPYDFNPSAIFHIEQQRIIQNGAPRGTIILKVPGYDGQEYWQLARNFPSIPNPNNWTDLAIRSPGSYAYQRILLPAVLFLVSAGQERWLPFANILVNIVALLVACALVLRNRKDWLAAIAIALCPAATIALHFGISEPLTIVLLTAFLLRYSRSGLMDGIDITLLSLLVVSREINVIFLVLLGGWMLLHHRWRDLGRLIVPLAVFVGWHAVIYGIFSEIPFFESTAKNDMPLKAILDILTGEYGYNKYTLSSIGLFLLFVVPGIVLMAKRMWTTKKLELLPTLSLAFLLLMLCMPYHIWGSITSIGRAITPVYPLTILALSESRSIYSRMSLAAILFLGLTAGFGLALIPHPYFVS